MDGYKLNPNTGTCVRFIDLWRSWTQAQAYCESKGEHLLTLPTMKDADWLAEQRSLYPGLLML